MELTLAHTPDSDDAFMFHAVSSGEVDTEGLSFRNVILDIETLNRDAEAQKYDITALSLHGLVYVADRYACMRAGASVGDGYGPTLVARKAIPPGGLGSCRIAIPGERTTATLLLRLMAPEAKNLVVKRFDLIPEAVSRGEADVGLLIHEGQITFEKLGLVGLVDLGAWWKGETGLPSVLGVNAIRRALPTEVRARAGRVLRRCVEFALQNREAALDTAAAYQREMAREEMARFVSMYVNGYTIELGERGERSIGKMIGLAVERGLIPPGSSITFA